MNNATAAKTEAIATADAHLNNAGLPTYTQLVAMLDEARALGLNFDCGTAYIRRIYIDHQDDLVARMMPAIRAVAETQATAG